MGFLWPPLWLIISTFFFPCVSVFNVVLEASPARHCQARSGFPVSGCVCYVQRCRPMQHAPLCCDGGRRDGPGQAQCPFGHHCGSAAAVGQPPAVHV